MRASDVVAQRPGSTHLDLVVLISVVQSVTVNNEYNDKGIGTGCLGYCFFALRQNIKL